MQAFSFFVPLSCFYFPEIVTPSIAIQGSTEPPSATKSAEIAMIFCRISMILPEMIVSFTALLIDRQTHDLLFVSIDIDIV